MRDNKEQIILQNILVRKNRVEYVYSATEGLQQYFRLDETFAIEYPEDISIVPNAVLAIPFVCNVLPIIWLEDAELILPELDEDFYNSIQEFKKGYINMYPDAEFKGKISVGEIVNCRREKKSGAAEFFSGGLDATTTLLRHLDEKPDLISIWGSDIPYDNEEGWKPIQKAIDEVAAEYQVKHINIHSSFRQFDNERELGKVHTSKLHDGWWHGVKHGIGLLGHSAPYVWLHGLSVVYIASSNCPADGVVTCASNPSIDNFVRFCGAEVVHDGFEMNRPEKAIYVVEYHKALPDKKIALHVCWESTDGNNCCHCEKCYRTMAAIWIGGDDPRNYGMNYPSDVFEAMYKKIALELSYLPIKRAWLRVQEGMKANHNVLVTAPYYKKIKWIENYNFNEPDNNRCRKWYKFKCARGIRGKLATFKFYQKLHEMKERVK